MFGAFNNSNNFTPHFAILRNRMWLHEDGITVECGVHVLTPHVDDG